MTEVGKAKGNLQAARNANPDTIGPSGQFGPGQSVSQLFHGPAPRSPLHRLAVRLRHSRSNTTGKKPELELTKT